MACILTSVSQQIVDAIETNRKAALYSLNEFVCDWDFEGREQDVQLTDERIHVRVVVPVKWEVSRRITRTELGHIGAWYIDVRQKLGIDDQGSDSNVERDRVAKLTELVEGLHASMFTNPPADDPYDLQWLAEYSGSPKQSEIMVAYSTKVIRQQRQFYGVCQELFQVTQ